MAFVDDALKVLGNIGPNKQNLSILDSCLDRLIPFVGAGLSIHFGYPSWDALLGDMAEQVGLGQKVRNHVTKLEFEEAAELVAKQASLNYLDDTLKNVFDHKKIRRPIDEGAVRHLPMIARGPVLTTNFDRVIEMAFDDAKVPFVDIFHGSRIREATHALQFDEPFLLKLHGDYKDSEHRILTLTQYTAEYGSVDPATADLDLPLPTVLGQALASRPLIFLGCSLKSDRTLTVIGRIAQRYSGIVHFALLSDSERTTERLRQLYLWNIRPVFFLRGEFRRVDRFLACLAQACQSIRTNGSPANPKPKRDAMRSDSPVNRKKSTESIRKSGYRRTFRNGSLDRSNASINGYKLFYFRMTRKLSFSELSRLSGVNRDLLRRIERVDNSPRVRGIQRFQQCSVAVLTKLERALECWGQLQGGRSDDSLSMYLQFYFTYKGSRAATTRTNQLKLKFQTKAVAFDFDGTLTKRTDNRTTWEKLWVALGYTIDDCVELHRRFNRKEFTHERWCELTRDKFFQGKLREDQLMQIARDTHLIEGTRETLEFLKKKGVRLYILSGSIKQVIKAVLGDLYEVFDEVKANEIIFDSAGVIDRIIGTRYDFEGKAKFLSDVISDQGLSWMDVLFVGNSLNDVWASQSGARTLCVNPHMTNPDIEEHWTYAINEMTNLQQILKYVEI